MKKTFTILLAAIMTASLMASCNTNDNGSSGSSAGSSNSSMSSNTSVPSSSETSKVSTATAAGVYDAIDKAFADKYPDVGSAISNMPTSIDDTVLNDKFGLSPDLVEEYKGAIAGVMNNCDMLLVVKVADGKMEDVKKALEKAKDDQTKQFEQYGVMGNTERTAAAKVVENGNFAALLMVGIMPEDPDAAVDFTEDVKLAEDTFNKTVDAGK